METALGKALTACREEVQRHWPHLWPVVDACLSCYATLLLRDVSQSLALVLVARSGAGKGTVLGFFQGGGKTLWRDTFTRASLLSGHGDISKKEVEENALFRIVKDKVLLVGDLAPVLRAGEKDKLSDFYTHFSVWMDGKGLSRQVGTHGEVGAKGDYQFVMIGAMTPPNITLWRGMAELGPRLLFMPLERGVEIVGEGYSQAAENCARSVRNVINMLFASSKLRFRTWPERSAAVGKRLHRYGQIIALAQTLPASSRTEELVAPTPAHLRQRLMTLLSGRALLYERPHISEGDLSLAELIVSRTGPARRGSVLLAMDRGAKTITEIADTLGWEYHAVWSTLDDLRSSSVVSSAAAKQAFIPTGQGRPSEAWHICENLL